MALREVKKDTVAFLMPCGGPVESRVVQSCMNLTNRAMLEGITISHVGVTDRTLIHTARNMLTVGFLNQTDSEWMFWCDSDMILESRTIPVLLKWAKKLDSKMVTGIYFQRGGDHRPVVWRKEARDRDGNLVLHKDDEYTHYFVYPGMKSEDGSFKIVTGGPPFKVDVAGFGCALIHRDVVASMKPPYFKFNQFVGEDGREHESSEDFHFFVEAGRLGYELWAIPELECGHLASAPVITFRDCRIGNSTKIAEERVLDIPKEAVRV